MALSVEMTPGQLVGGPADGSPTAAAEGTRDGDSTPPREGPAAGVGTSRDGGGIGAGGGDAASADAGAVQSFGCNRWEPTWEVERGRRALLSVSTAASEPGERLGADDERCRNWASIRASFAAAASRLLASKGASWEASVDSRTDSCCVSASSIANDFTSWPSTEPSVCAAVPSVLAPNSHSHDTSVNTRTHSWKLPWVASHM